MAKFAPLHDRILVRRVEEASTTRGGIIIPHSAKDKPQEGEVISTGKGRTNDERQPFRMAVKEGDRILFGKYSGTELRAELQRRHRRPREDGRNAGEDGG